MNLTTQLKGVKEIVLKKNNFFEGFIQFYYFQIHTKTLLSLPFIYE